MKMTERQHHISQVRQSLAYIETDSLYKCVRYLAAQPGLVLCGSARVFLEDSKLSVSRGNIFYWLEHDAPLGMVDWIADTENFAAALWSAA
jgi:hypothetical protein